MNIYTHTYITYITYIYIYMYIYILYIQYLTHKLGNRDAKKTSSSSLAYALVEIRKSQPATTELRRPIGCLKLQVIFRKRATNYRALLRKMTYTDKRRMTCKDKASYTSLPPSTFTM